MVNLVDDTLLVADPAAVAAAVRDPARWRAWWPDLHLVVREDRGEQGLRWAVTGRLVGSSEIWLEPWADGAVLHYILRAEMRRLPWPRWRRTTRREVERQARAFKRSVWALKEALEGDRPAGTPRPGSVAAGTAEDRSSGPSVPAAGRGVEEAMVADRASGSVVITADRAAILTVIADFPAYPQWVDMITVATVVETGPDGRAAAVRFVLDAGILRDEYVLRYDWSVPDAVSWHLVSSTGTLKSQDGSYVLTDAGDGATRVTYALAVEVSLGIRVLGAFKRKAEQMIVDTALAGLARRVDSGR